MPDSSAQARVSALRATPFARPELRLPAHCKSPARPSPAVFEMKRMLRRRGLHSVCEEARCPNLAECFARGTVTFMLLGDVCTRACRFCHVATGLGRPVDPREPEQVAEAAAELGLRHVVLTSVNRDDLPDQGSEQFARTIAALRVRAPSASVEVLTPDFRGDAECIDRVCAAGPEVYNHNLETVPRLYRQVRIGARYDRSLALLARVKARRPQALAKSGLMLGLGETRDELLAVCRDLRAAGVDFLTLGQYLRPTLSHLPVARYVEPLEFTELAGEARALGFRHVESGPLVRSSFHADTALELLS
ncbi:MAG TPA: lipoyl synthase [Myxococcota bacterium]|nr:lipoyl synthase [Myxococcota bacterium]